MTVRSLINDYLRLKRRYRSKYHLLQCNGRRLQLRRVVAERITRRVLGRQKADKTKPSHKRVQHLI